MKKVYIKEENGYVIDLVTVKEFVANRDDYREVEVENFPSTILNQCYKFDTNAFVLDEDKLAQVKAESREAIQAEFLLELIKLEVL